MFSKRPKRHTKNILLNKKIDMIKYLLGEIDLEPDLTGLRIGERLRLRPIGDLLGGLRARLGGELPA